MRQGRARTTTAATWLGAATLTRMEPRTELGEFPSSRRAIHHVGFNVPDLRAAIDTWVSVFGAGPFYVNEHVAYDESTRDGTPVVWDHSAGFGPGAEVMYPLADQFYGERGGRVKDPFGQEWMLSTRLEKLTAAEIAARASAHG